MYLVLHMAGLSSLSDMAKSKIYNFQANIFYQPVPSLLVVPGVDVQRSGLACPSSPHQQHAALTLVIVIPVHLVNLRYSNANAESDRYFVRTNHPDLYIVRDNKENIVQVQCT